MVSQQGLSSLASLLSGQSSLHRAGSEEWNVAKVIGDLASLVRQDLGLDAGSLKELIVAETVGDWKQHLVLFREGAGVEATERRVEAN